MCPDGSTHWLNAADVPGYADYLAAPCSPSLDTDADGRPDGTLAAFASDANSIINNTEGWAQGTPGWELVNVDCWGVTPFGATPDALTVTAGTFCSATGSPPPPDAGARMYLDVAIDQDVAGRLFALGFDACIPDETALEVTGLIWDGGPTVIERLDLVRFRGTTTSDEWDTGALDFSTPTGCGWLRHSFVFRVPENPSGTISAMGFRFDSTLLWANQIAIDNIEVVEVDAQLRNMDLGPDDAGGAIEYDGVVDSKSSLVVELWDSATQQCTFELDEDCFEARSYVPTTISSGDERGWQPFFDPETGEVSDYIGSIEVIDTTCDDDTGLTHDLTGKSVCVSYRSWTHQGLMPNASGGPPHSIRNHQNGPPTPAFVRAFPSSARSSGRAEMSMLTRASSGRA